MYSRGKKKLQAEWDESLLEGADLSKAKAKAKAKAGHGLCAGRLSRQQQNYS